MDPSEAAIHYWATKGFVIQALTLLSSMFSLDLGFHASLVRHAVGEAAHGPHLTRVARLVLGAAASEAACERTFSIATNVIGKNRNRLSPEDLDMLVFLKRNMKKLRADTEKACTYVTKRLESVRGNEREGLRTLPPRLEFWLPPSPEQAGLQVQQEATTAEE